MLQGLKTYHRQSRETFTSLVLILPLLIAYQIGLLFTGGVKNGADFVSGLLLALVGGDFGLYFAVNVAALAVFVGVAWAMRKKGKFNPKLWLYVTAESTLYAAFFGSVIITLMQYLQLDVLLASGVFSKASVLDKVVLSLGAGVYEELVFRGILLGGLFVFFKRTAKWKDWTAGLVAIVISSFVFSGIHHVGPLAESFEMGAFVFRFLAGVLFAVIYYVRGLAVAVFTHAFYDLWVLVFS